MAPGLDAGGSAARPDRYWQVFALAVGLAIVSWWYRDTLMAMVHIWERSDTFAHGYVVAPIALWCVWQSRSRFQAVPSRPSVLGLIGGLAAGFAWLLGQLASVDAVAQFAFVGMIVSMVWAVLGTAMARAYIFPLCFLAFMVPFGEFLFPTMMDWTSHFIISAVRLSGVPIYAEGRNMVIPSGSWQVVEGCSGVRYLIASIMVGSLFAYLNYRSLLRRVLFVIASVTVPIVANWLRAYGTVMLGHLSNNKLATGVDHIIYGWVFFGIVIMVLFWIGARWREDEPEQRATAVALEGVARDSASATAMAVGMVLALAAVLVWRPVLSAMDARIATDPVQLTLPAGGAGWSRIPLDRLPEWSPSFGGMRATARAAYRQGDSMVGVYVAYYRDQKPGEELINSENRILISKHPVWKQTEYGERRVQVGSDSLPVRFSAMRSPETRQMVWSSYWIGGRWTTSDVLAKVYLALSRLAGEGDDSAVVIMYAPFLGNEQEVAVQRLEQFAGDLAPEIGAQLATAAEQGR